MNFALRVSLTGVLCVPALLGAQEESASPAPARLLATDGNPWIVRYEEPGLRVETRELDGSTIDQFRGIAIMQAPPAAVLARIGDVDAYTSWFPNTVEAGRVRLADGRFANYVRTGTPWPVKDRDAVYVQRVIESPGLIRIEVGVAPDVVQVFDSAVRVREAGGFWNLREVSGNEKGPFTEVTWQFHLDPAGRIPSALINTRIVDSPRIALTELRAYFSDYYDSQKAQD